MGTGELLGNLTNCWGVTCDGLASRPGGVEILLAASCYGNQDKLWPDEPVLAPKASLLVKVLCNMSLQFLLPWQHTGFQTSTI